LIHPNLVKILSQGELEGRDYIIKEYFEAKALAAYLGQVLPVDTAVEILLQVASALDTAHQQDILHQALQPQSIYITQDFKTAKLTNFGCNLLTDISRISESAEIISTFGYLSPESSGILRKPVDQRSDIYSLGILFYQLLTGRLPYIAEDIAGLIHQHIATKPVAPSQINSQIPPVLDNIILRLIAKEPQERYQSLKGLIVDLKEYQAQRKRGKVLIDFEIARSDRLAQISFSTRLIGRDKELNELNSLLDMTKQGQGSLVFVFGEPGIGKSRLVDELRGSIHSLNGLFCGGKCYQFEFKTPYKVFAEAIEAYIEKVKRLSVQEQNGHIARIKEALGELGGEIVKICPAITELIGQPPKLAELEPEKEKTRFLITVINFLVSLSSSNSPLLMFLDDLQWADDGSLEILERFAEKIRGTSTLLIVSYRDNEVDQGHPLAQLIRKLKEQQVPLKEVPVRFFSLVETAQMISQIIMEKEEAALPLANELQERAKGNPFFTIELLHSLVDAKIVYLEGEHYVYDLDKLKDASLPTSIVDAVLKRMNDLSADALKILSYASVMGKELNFKLLTELTSQQSGQILVSIEDGIKNQLLYRDLTGMENVFFMHDRIREAFYQRVSQEERTPLHKHIAEVLEEQNKDDPGPILYDLAYHFTQGNVEDKALQYAIPAAHKAKSSYANTLAIQLYTTAKEILEKQGGEKTKTYLGVLENLGEVYRLVGRFDDSAAVLYKCESLASAGDVIYRSRILSKVADALFDKGAVGDSAQVIESTLALLKVRIPKTQFGVFLVIAQEFFIQLLHMWLPDVFLSSRYKGDERDGAILSLYNRLGHIYYFSDINKSFCLWLRGLNLGERVGPCIGLVSLYNDGAPVWASFPWFYRSFRDGRKGLKMAQDLGDRVKEGSANAYLSLCSFVSNNCNLSVEYGQKALSILKGIGAYWEAGAAYDFIVGSYQNTGKLKEADLLCEEFIASMKSVKSMQALGWGYLWRCRGCCFLGEVDDAVINEIKEANRLCRLTNDRGNIVYTTAYLAMALLRRSEYPQAVKAAEETISLFPTYNNKASWIFDLFPICAQIYLDISCDINTPAEQKAQYLKRSRWLCGESMGWAVKYPYCLGWSYQVNATYLWLTGHKRRAVRTWDKALNWLRTNKNNPGGDKYRIAYILLEEAKFLLQDNPQDKKALGNLLEAKELFSSMGCKLDLKTCNDLLQKIM
ncbi:MAG: AAA family ATPase, partial [Candidatus Omnitrophota bacterium]